MWTNCSFTMELTDNFKVRIRVWQVLVSLVFFTVLTKWVVLTEIGGWPLEARPTTVETVMLQEARIRMLERHTADWKKKYEELTWVGRNYGIDPVVMDRITGDIKKMMEDLRDEVRQPQATGGN